MKVTNPMNPTPNNPQPIGHGLNGPDYVVPHGNTEAGNTEAGNTEAGNTEAGNTEAQPVAFPPVETTSPSYPRPISSMPPSNASPNQSSPIQASPVHAPTTPSAVTGNESPRPTSSEAQPPNPHVDAAKETASAVLGEVRKAVKGASKREPYPFLALAALAGSLAWVLWKENGDWGFQTLKLWTIFVVVSALLVFTPMVRNVFRLDAHRAWQFCVAGAAGLGFGWVAFLLPSISTNHAFFGTIGVAAAGLAAWTAPGRPE
jgi:hypothetical protein